MNFGAENILCVEPSLAVLESRRAILKYSGYDAVSASPQPAESCSVAETSTCWSSQIRANLTYSK
jgi:hypothetical protein